MGNQHVLKFTTRVDHTPV
ncbi:hypothetical protein F383_33667 [Gossypium arboreum]|uniref:Uncharacterized protein n=1 Tax=Gossypium arboreum TaxID=29729 RepID=A0A0B0N562_GOSAR|nr:hypothetical protein F383_33667 [Gossypium arboreum]